MTARTAIVTGATGFAGTHLITHLAAAADTRVVAWARPSGRPAAAHAGVDWQHIDLLDARAVMDAVRDVQPSAIYHLAGASHVGQSWGPASSHLEVHVLGTDHVLRAVRAHAPTCRVLVISSGMVYRASNDPLAETAPIGPISPYALSKVAEEQLALHCAAADGLDIVVARPFNHIGPGQSPEFAAPGFARQIAAIEAGRAEPRIAVGNLGTERDISDVRDVVRIYRALMAKGRSGEIYNVCRGEAVSTRAILNGLLALSRTPVTVASDPSRLRPNDLPRMVGSPAKLLRDIGVGMTTPLAETLRDLLDSWRAAAA